MREVGNQHEVAMLLCGVTCALLQVRFFGKFLGTHADYYVFETSLKTPPEEPEQQLGEEQQQQQQGYSALSAHATGICMAANITTAASLHRRHPKGQHHPSRIEAAGVIAAGTQRAQHNTCQHAAERAAAASLLRLHAKGSIDLRVHILQTLQQLDLR